MGSMLKHGSVLDSDKRITPELGGLVDNLVDATPDSALQPSCRSSV